jgi:hypothetical protein
MRILLGQILPNIMPIMVVQMSLTMGYAILNAAGLSFIGLGVRPPTPEWGIMVAEGAAFMVSGEWWIAFFPGERHFSGTTFSVPGRRPISWLPPRRCGTSVYTIAITVSLIPKKRVLSHRT